MVSPEGLDESVSETVPVKPPNAVRVIKELFDAPAAWTVTELGLAVIVKPGPVTVNWSSIVWKRLLVLAAMSRV